MYPYAYDLSPLMNDISYIVYPYPQEEDDDYHYDYLNPLENDAVSETPSPLPLSMGWSRPPPNWNGPTTLWPHTSSSSSLSFSSTIPSWLLVPQSSPYSSDPVVVLNYFFFFNSFFLWNEWILVREEEIVFAMSLWWFKNFSWWKGDLGMKMKLGSWVGESRMKLMGCWSYQKKKKWKE